MTSVLGQLQSSSSMWSASLGVVLVVAALLAPCGAFDNDIEGWTESVKVNILKEVLENQYLRSPIAVVMDLTPDAVRNFKALWFETSEQNLPDRNIYLVPVAERDVGAPVMYDSNRLSAVLAALRPTENASVDEDAPAGPMLTGILSAIHRLPFDSAVLVVAGATPRDESLRVPVAEMLIRKRARLYAIWTGESNTGEEVLKEDALLTGGAFYYTTTNTVVRTRMQRLESAILEDDPQSILDRKDIKGKLESRFPLNSEDSGLRIQVRGNITQASLTDPQGISRNLLDTEENTTDLDVPISTRGVPPGVWHLVINGAPDETYDLSLLKEENNGTEETTENFTTEGGNDHDSLEIDDIRRRRSSDQSLAQLRFPEVIINETMRITGASGQQRAIIPVSIPVIVELASGSSLELRPGNTAQLTYDITNNMNFPTQMQFSGAGNGLVINSIQPQVAQFPPFGTQKVQVSITPLGQTVGSGKVTLSAFSSGGRPTSRDAIVYITNTIVKDTWDPELTYKFQGDCEQFRDPTNCENGQWSVEATAKDEDSGLLRVMSEPYGLLFQSVFTAGTKSPVTVTYTASCCRPKVDIWAEDLRGNYKKKSLDVINQGLLAGEIAAVVVGVVLLILLILLIIFIVLYCRKRKSDRIVLPRHKGESR